MKIRVARHTADLQRITKFYTELLGLEILGKFTAHNNYDGIFLGVPGESWHLEFTVSDEKPNHTPDDDDLLVFYSRTKQDYEKLKARFKDNNIAEAEPKNPYWKLNGATYTDPDGYRIVIALQKS